LSNRASGCNSLFIIRIRLRCGASPGASPPRPGVGQETGTGDIRDRHWQSEMASKTITTLLLTAACTLVVLGIANLWRDIGCRGLITKGHWARVNLHGGNMELVYARTTAVSSAPRRMTPLRGPVGVLSLGTGNNNRWRWVFVSIPLWMLTGALLLQPTLAYFRGPVRRRLRLRRSQCLSCGYSLTGNSSGTCPECGNVCPRTGLPGEMPMTT